MYNKMRIVSGIILLAILFSTAASASNLAVIKIDSENVTFLNHTSDINGNWINLTGGTSVRIPELIFNYSGVGTINYTKSGKTINITSPANYEVTYPFTTHPIYTNNSNVNATFYNSSDLTGYIDIYLTRTSPTELRNIASNMVDGNTTPFRNLLNTSINKSLNLPLSSSNQLNFGALSAGDYVAIVMKNESNQDNLTIISATTFQVLEHNLTATASGSVLRGNFLDIPLSLDASGTFTYGAFLIHNDSYKSTLRLRSNGTKAGTNLSADSQSLVDAFTIAGIGLSNVNKSTVQNIANGVIGANNGTIFFKPGASNSTSISLITDDLKLGRYILSIGVWSNTAGERLVAFYQREVEVTSVTVDNTPPMITITFPTNGSTLNVLNNSVIGSITDASDISTANLTLNNVLVTNLSKGSFNVKVNYTAGASNIIKLYAKDIAGNTNSTQILVYVLPNNITVNTTTVANQTVEVNASETQNYTNTVIELNAVINATVTLRINGSTNASALDATPATAAYGLAQNQRSLDKYIEVNITNITRSELNYVTLRLYYTIADLDRNGDGDADDTGDLNPSTLKLYWYWNNATGAQKWFPLTEGANHSDKLDLQGNPGPVVIGSPVLNETDRSLKVTLNHFSVFTLVGELITAPAEAEGVVGGGGGGGVTTVEPLANIELQETREEFLWLGIPATYRFTTPELAVYELVITPNISAGTTSAKVEQLKDTSKLVTSPPPGIVYKNLNLWVGTSGFATPKNIKEAIIRFRVPNSWLASVDTNTLAMYQWYDNKWNPLATKQTGKDANYSYYEASTNRFSPFAISAKAIAVVTPTVTILPTPTVTVTPPPAVPQRIPGWVYGIIILVAIGLAAYYLIRVGKKPAEKKK